MDIHKYPVHVSMLIDVYTSICLQCTCVCKWISACVCNVMLCNATSRKSMQGNVMLLHGVVCYSMLLQCNVMLLHIVVCYNRFLYAIECNCMSLCVIVGKCNAMHCNVMSCNVCI
jgi:hypothetical protein